LKIQFGEYVDDYCGQVKIYNVTFYDKKKTAVKILAVDGNRRVHTVLPVVEITRSECIYIWPLYGLSFFE
jgi:hypothetical protein